MQRTRVLLVALLLGLLSSPGANAADTCAALNTPTVADDKLTVTLSSITLNEKSGSTQLTISYKLLNATTDSKIDEQGFKLFFTDGTSEPQYGFFGSFFPGDFKDRSYTWEYLKSQVPLVISYNAGFFSTVPSSTKLNWVLPGQGCKLTSPAIDKSAADKAAADRAAATKAAADKAAADKAAADRAAAEKVAAAESAAASAASAAAAAAAVDSISKLIDDVNAQAKAAADAANKIAGDVGAPDALNQSAEGISAKRKTTGKAKVKKKAITCTKGNLVLKVSGAKPVCPSGYKKK
jgi:hypothetical protein